MVVGAVAGLFTLDNMTNTVNLTTEVSQVFGAKEIIYIGVGMLSFYALSKWFEYKQLQDAKDGRYIPSGLKEVAE